MKIFIDTSVIIDIERGNDETADLLDYLLAGKHSILISSVVASEIFTGTYLSRLSKKSRVCKFHALFFDLKVY